MTQYLLNIYQPDGVVPPAEFLAKVMKDLGAINDEIRGAGSWVFSGGLHDASSSTVVHHKDGEVLMTDGPYAEGKEHIGGFWIVDAPDLDAALGWADKIVRVTTLPIEVRPFRDPFQA
ncbi:MAG TPA: YciI family protein [Micromonosporaceae bacterium]|nr:YciI family protein [Micromonosporaceae bacterium]